MKNEINNILDGINQINESVNTSVTDRFFEKALLIILCKPYFDPSIDMEKMLTMKLFVDLVESLYGPIDLSIKESKKEIKKQLLESFGEDFGRTIYSTWKEFIKNESIEADVLNNLKNIMDSENEDKANDFIDLFGLEEEEEIEDDESNETCEKYDLLKQELDLIKEKLNMISEEFDIDLKKKDKKKKHKKHK
jgi:5'-deoxynucleotidase YfbR-like HD superfamily hydrolase